MAEAGKVIVSLSPYEAALISHELKAAPAPLFGTEQIDGSLLPNGIRCAAVDRLKKIGTRKRSSSHFQRIDIEIDREDAFWFAAKVRGGMMFGRKPSWLSPTTTDFCRRCSLALTKRTGRPKLRGGQLAQAAAHQVSAVEDGVDPRNLKRLKSRLREEAYIREEMAKWPGILSRDSLHKNLP